MSGLRHTLETHQVAIYFGTVILAALVGFLVPATAMLEGGINPALAAMLFATFLQVPLADLGRALVQVRFIGALLAAKRSAHGRPRQAFAPECDRLIALNNHARLPQVGQR